MLTSVIFSVAIYQTMSSEVSSRLEKFQNSLQNDNILGLPMFRIGANLRAAEEAKSQANIATGLVYVNLFVLVTGGIGSYLLAKRHLKPIEEAHEAQSRFTSDASHELRTPLAVMKAELEVALMDENSTKEELKNVLRSNIEEVDKLSKLAEMLLRLSKLEHEKIKFEPIDLNLITKETIKNFGNLAKRIKLNNPNKTIVIGNETSLAELTKILIDNAILYSPKESVINIKISKSNGLAKFEISNTGKGIKAEKLPHIFDRFYRADNSRSNGHMKGYGLGLALAKKIIELHKGGLSVSSTPNELTTFTFTLPLKSAKTQS